MEKGQIWIERSLTCKYKDVEGHVEENTIISFFCSYYSQQFFADHVIECWV